MDLTATTMNNSNSEYIVYGTDLSVEIPEGYVGLIFPRSSISIKDLILANSVGVIDSGYRGEILVRFKRIDLLYANYYFIGDKIAQLMILPIPYIQFEEVAELSPSKRAEGGFGSTDVKH